MIKPVPHETIADYVKELEQPGIPYVSRSHLTRYFLNVTHGQEVIQQRLDSYFKAVREFNASKGSTE